MRLLAIIIISTLLVACSTNPPEPPTVDGSDRQPINSAQTIAALSLRAEMAGESTKPKKSAVTPLKLPSKTITVLYGAGDTDFKPTAAQAHDIGELLPSAEHIEIRGRTDADKPTSEDVAVARKRAIGAGLYLVSNGAKSSQIAMDFKGGDFVTGNGSPAGKAKNRRVEIEIFSKPQ